RIAQLVLRPSIRRIVAQANLEIANRVFELSAELRLQTARERFIHEFVGSDLAQGHAGFIGNIDFLRDRARKRDGKTAGSAAASRAGAEMAIDTQQVVTDGQLR